MRNISRIAILLAATALTAVSCMSDVGKPDERRVAGQPVTITMDPGLTRAGDDIHPGDVLDRAVKSLRVLIYNSRTGRLVWNFTPDDLSEGIFDGDEDGTHDMELEILTGTYDFVFIGNERSGYAADPALGNLLANEDNFDTMAELRQLTFGFSAFPICRDIEETTELIPMVTFMPAVKVLGDNEIDSPSTGHITGIWKVALDRVGIRIDIELTLTADQYVNYLDSKFLLWDPARAAYLLPRNDNMEHDTDGDDNLNYDAADILCDVRDELDIDDEPTGRKIVSGSYLLPERILSAVNDKEANAMTIELFNSGSEAKGTGKSAALWYEDEDDQPTWSFPRNTFLKMVGTVLEDKIVFSDITVIDWGGENNIDITDRGIILPKKGIPAPPGVLGVNARTGELTLVGSVHYKGTDVATDKREAGKDDDATEEFGPISSDTVFVAYFKWGSLIGLNGDDSEFFNVGNLAWAPKSYNVASLMKNIGNPETGEEGRIAWGRIPFASQNDFPMNQPSFGLGDPCAYANKGTATARYAMPVSGAANGWWDRGTFGTVHDAPWPLSNGATFVPQAGEIPAGARTADWSMFLAVAGQRNEDTGLFTTLGGGMYWSSAPQDATKAFGMDFASDNVAPSVSYIQSKAIAIRCIDQTPKPVLLTYDVHFEFDGGTEKTAIESYYTDGTPIAWEVAGYDTDDDGEFDDEAPNWLTFPTSGDGGIETMEDYVIELTAKEREIVVENEWNIHLRSLSDKAGTSASTPWNLSNQSNGMSDAIENTANCYIINEPGYYRLPLVYGNAVKNGYDNENSYKYMGDPDAPSSLVVMGNNKPHSLILKNFVNHAKENITSPYISDHAEPHDAVVVWMDAPGLVVIDIAEDAITGSGHNAFLNFRVPKENIAQGNAVVAVRDSEGTILWSWHIWITAEMAVNAANPATDRAVNKNGVAYHFMQHHIGWASRGTSHYGKAERKVDILITQTGIDNPISKAFTVTQGFASFPRYGTAPYWHPGRKDPMPPANGIIERTEPPLYGEYPYVFVPFKLIGNSTTTGTLDMGIRNPSTFYHAEDCWYSPVEGVDGLRIRAFLAYINIWNANQTDYLSTYLNPELKDYSVKKTVYDPSPVGFHVPPAAAFTGFITGDSNNKVNGTSNHVDGFNLYLDESKTQTAFWPLAGIRDANGLANWLTGDLQSRFHTLDALRSSAVNGPDWVFSLRLLPMFEPNNRAEFTLHGRPTGCMIRCVAEEQVE